MPHVIEFSAFISTSDVSLSNVFELSPRRSGDSTLLANIIGNFAFVHEVVSVGGSFGLVEVA